MVAYGRTDELLYKVEGKVFTICREDKGVCFVIDFEEMKCREVTGDEARKLIDEMKSRMRTMRESMLETFRRIRKLQREIEEMIEREIEELLKV